jgi:hypothetical protein
MTCNTDLGADGASVDSHLASNPTHTVGNLIFDNSETIATVQGITRVYNNELFAWDESRQKWLSVTRRMLMFGIPTTNQNNVYLRYFGVMTPSSNRMGYEVPSSATITKLTASRNTGTGTGIMSIREYGAADLASITLTANVYAGSNLALNVDVTAGQNLSGYLTGSASSSYPQLSMELAWRI